MLGDMFDRFPEWAVFAGSVVLFFLSTEAGFRVGRYVNRRKEQIESGSTGLVTGSLLGLVSFLLAFTFGIAAANFSERRGVVLDEANAIGTAWLRADLLTDAVAADRLRELLMTYTEVRSTVATQPIPANGFADVIRASEALHGDIWALAATQAREGPSPATALVVSAVNDVIDLHSLRVAAGVRHTIPDVIWIALYGISVIALATTGYRFGASIRARSELMPGVVIAFACLITLIADLDDPRHGFLTSDQTPMLDLLATMRAGDG